MLSMTELTLTWKKKRSDIPVCTIAEVDMFSREALIRGDAHNREHALTKLFALPHDARNEKFG